MRREARMKGGAGRAPCGASAPGRVAARFGARAGVASQPSSVLLVMVAGPLAPVGETQDQGLQRVRHADAPHSGARRTRTSVPRHRAGRRLTVERVRHAPGRRRGGPGSGDAAGNQHRFYQPQLRAQFTSVNGVAAQLTGRQIVKPGRREGHLGDHARRARSSSRSTRTSRSGRASPTSPSSGGTSSGGYVNLPAIAIVDSGIEANRADFGCGSKVVAPDDVMTSLAGNSRGDGRGHGTFVAGHRGGRRLELRRRGSGRSDRLDRRDGRPGHGHDERRHRRGRLDPREQGPLQHPGRELLAPLGRPEQLHVRSAGEGGRAALVQRRHRRRGGRATTASNGEPSGVLFAPGNDPFVITVGATDIGNASSTDGRLRGSVVGVRLHARTASRKPELGAPGRYMIGPVPTNSTLVAERPEQVRGTGYMELSGTSFAAPVVAGIAAYLLGEASRRGRPTRSRARSCSRRRTLPTARPGSLGVGEVDGARAPNYVIDTRRTRTGAEPVRRGRPGRRIGRRSSTRPAGRTWPRPTPRGRTPPGPRLLGERLLGERLLGERLVGERLVGVGLLGERVLGGGLVGVGLLGEPCETPTRTARRASSASAACS